MQVNVAFVSLYQTSSHQKSDPDSSTYRGTIIVPFFVNRTTLYEFYNGLEYRLNKYCQMHTHGGNPAATSAAQSAATSKKQSAKRNRRGEPLGKSPEATAANTNVGMLSSSDSLLMHPQSCYFCPHCSRSRNTEGLISMNNKKNRNSDASSSPLHVLRDSDITLPTLEHQGAPVCACVSQYPVITVLSVARRNALSVDVSDEVQLSALWSASGPNGIIPPYSRTQSLEYPRDTHATLNDEAQHLNVVFQSKVIHSLLVMSQDDGSNGAALGDEQPRLTVDGIVHRAVNAVDHCPNLMCNTKPIDVAVRLLSTNRVYNFRFAAICTFQDLIIRLEACSSTRIGRLFDAQTGAAVLPCEKLCYISWKLHSSRLCAEPYAFPALLPLTSAAVSNKEPLDLLGDDRSMVSGDSYWGAMTPRLRSEAAYDHRARRTFIRKNKSIDWPMGSDLEESLDADSENEEENAAWDTSCSSVSGETYCLGQERNGALPSSAGHLLGNQKKDKAIDGSGSSIRLSSSNTSDDRIELESKSLDDCSNVHNDDDSESDSQGKEMSDTVATQRIDYIPLTMVDIDNEYDVEEDDDDVGEYPTMMNDGDADDVVFL